VVKCLLREYDGRCSGRDSPSAAIHVAVKMVAVIRPVVVDNGCEAEPQAGIDAPEDLTFARIAEAVSNGFAGAAETPPANAHDVDRITKGVIAEDISTRYTTTIVGSCRQDCFYRHADVGKASDKICQRGAHRWSEPLGNAPARTNYINVIRSLFVPGRIFEGDARDIADAQQRRYRRAHKLAGCETAIGRSAR